MNGVGNQFFARPGFSLDQYGRIRRCHPPNLPKEFLHGRTLPDDIFEPITMMDFVQEKLFFQGQPLIQLMHFFERALFGHRRGNEICNQALPDDDLVEKFIIQCSSSKNGKDTDDMFFMK